MAGIDMFQPQAVGVVSQNFQGFVEHARGSNLVQVSTMSAVRHDKLSQVQLDGTFDGVGVTYKPTDEADCVEEVWEFRKAMNHLMEKNRERVLPKLLASFSESASSLRRAMWETVCREKVWFNWLSVQWQDWKTSFPAATPVVEPPAAGHHDDLAAKKAILEKAEFHKRVDAKMSGVGNSKMHVAGIKARVVSTIYNATVTMNTTGTRGH
jgi:hypothetical protein